VVLRQPSVNRGWHQIGRVAVHRHKSTHRFVSLELANAHAQ
jgi:hypothetical protein